MLTALSATLGHAWRGNVMVVEGCVVGIGGLVGAQLGTRALPRLSEATVQAMFRSLMVGLALYTFWQATRA